MYVYVYLFYLINYDLVRRVVLSLWGHLALVNCNGGAGREGQSNQSFRIIKMKKKSLKGWTEALVAMGQLTGCPSGNTWHNS